MSRAAHNSLLVVAGGIAALLVSMIVSGSNMNAAANMQGTNATSSFAYTFNVPGTLNETGSMGDTASPYWWLNSGGQFIIKGGIGETMQGNAPLLNRWRIAYALSNSRDTDGGLHPQNLFRLVSLSEWNNVSEEVSYDIVRDNFSASPNRNASNGLLLMSRYHLGGQTLYYAGIRVDGTAVIKKKFRGTYYTMAQTPVFPGIYSRDPSSGSSQDLLPHGEWIRLRMDTITGADGSVTVALYAQTADSSWEKLLSATDDGGSSVGGTPPITGMGYIGIRTDFMDVRFSDFTAQTLD